MRRLRPIASCTTTFALLCLVGLACSPTTAPESAVLITIDTLRADHLSQAGHPRLTSPVLDALAERGTRFSWAFSTSSYTVPSHTSMMVGRYPSFHGPGLTNSGIPLMDDETTLAEILSGNGYRTFAVVSNYVLRRRSGLHQGFEIYDDAFTSTEANRDLPERRAVPAVDRAVQLLDEAGDDPFFLWLHLQDPHGPYAPPASIPRPPLRDARAGAQTDPRTLPAGRDNSGYGALPRYQAYEDEFEVEQFRARYEREIALVDREIGRFLAALEERGRSQETFVVVTADHGEALGEDGYWFGHSHSVAIDQVHVPLLFVGPGIRAGAVVKQPVSNIDVFATLLDLLGAVRPQGFDSQSRSLVATLRDGFAVPDAPFFTESVSQRGIVAGDLYLQADRRPLSDALFWRVNPVTMSFFKPLGTRAVRLSDEGAVAAEAPPALAAALEDYAAVARGSRAEFARKAPALPLSPQEQAMLRSLGYFDEAPSKATPAEPEQ